MIRNLLLTGGPGHAFETSASLLVDLLAEAGITTEVVFDPAEAIARVAAAEAGASDPLDLVTVHALRWRMEQDRYEDLRADHAVGLAADDLAVLDRFVRSGGGLVALHTAVICFDAEPVWHRLIGASWHWDHSTHPPAGPFPVRVTAAGQQHELTRDIGDFTIDDEAYGFLDEVVDLVPLLVAEHGGRTHPLLWARIIGAGRVVTDLLGHGPDSFEHPAHRAVLSRSFAWAAGRSRSPAARATRRPA